MPIAHLQSGIVCDTTISSKNKCGTQNIKKSRQQNNFVIIPRLMAGLVSSDKTICRSRNKLFSDNFMMAKNTP